jgi:hypothetical protein
MQPSSRLLRSCGRGNACACDIAKKLKRLDVLFAGSVLTFSDVNEKSDNPNHLPFTGTLLLTDVPSDKPPHGSEGHRIFVSTAAARKAIVDLPGQAVNYQPENLSAHASRHKVGVITKAWISGNKVKVSGFIWVHDFPEAKVLRNRSDLGMSMELADVLVQDEDADVWNLTKFSFTGGTILKKSAAAYTKTDLAAVAAAAEEKRGATMKHEKKDKKKVAAAHRDTKSDTNVALMTQAISASLGGAVSNALSPLVAEIKASNERVMDEIAEVGGHLRLMQAAASGGGDEDEEIEDDDDRIVVHAAHREDDASASASEEMEAAEDDASASASMEAARRKGNSSNDDDGDDDFEEDDSSSSASASEMEAMEDLGLEDASEEPGEINKGAHSKGNKTTVTKPPRQGEHFKGNVAKGRLQSAARGGKVKGKPFPKLHSRAENVQITSINAAAEMIEQLHSEHRKLHRQLKAQAEGHTLQVRKLSKKLQRVTAQAARFAELEGRRSTMSAELVNLGEKVGVDFNEARVTGQKFSVRAFDTILAAAEQSGIPLNPQQRVTMKMLAEEHGLLDEGVVNRMGRA